MLTRENVVLCVVDVQDGLLPKIPVGEAVVEQVVRLIRFCRLLEIPVLWNEQYPRGLGRTNARIVSELEGVAVIEKVSFGCFGEPRFVEALEAMGRKQVVVCGIEAHVCVAQTVLQGLEQGYEMFVPRDAVGSRGKLDFETGLKRMERHGAEIVTCEMAMFEILRVAGTAEFKRVLPLFK